MTALAALSPPAQALHAQLQQFVQQRVLPADAKREQELRDNALQGRPHAPSPTVERLKAEARAQGLWNLFLPGEHGAHLSNLEYATLAEVMGVRYWCSEVFNCAAPDTGNMELLARYGSPDQRARWLVPLLAGEIRSAFAMTEPAVASSDATNVCTRIRRDGDHYVITGRKWYITGACAERCTLLIVMGQTAPDDPDRHRRQSMILVPRDTPGVRIVRDMGLFGYFDPPGGHAEIEFDDARVPADHLLLGEGRGFEIAQGRLGPGRLHHCMRLVGMAEAALRMTCERLAARVAFGRPLSEQGVWRERIADARILIDQTRRLVLHAAAMVDEAGPKAAAKEIAMIKVAAPHNCTQVIDWAIQAHGAAGYSQDTPLAQFYAYARHLRTADGPDEVHRNAIAKMELAPYLAKDARTV